ncbi:MAG: GNAT family N-acetyltransferase [Haloferacaceae archaeon]
MATTEVRELTTAAEWRAAFEVIGHLRDHLTEAEYLDYLAEMRDEGYRLFAVCEGNEIVSVAGVVVRTNLYNGRHLFVCDLVTRPERRSEGHGARLMGFVEDWARDRGCEHVALESGRWRDEAHRFYEATLGMERFCYTFRKPLDGA